MREEITEGRGNCFPLAILAQCRRVEVFRELDGSIQNLIQQDDPTLLRRAVYTFIKNSRNQKIKDYKRRYEEVLAVIDNRDWRGYWEVMVRNYEWVDYIFVQSTAWFLSHDIIIVTTTSTESRPYLTISGNLTDETVPCPGIELTIGSKSQVHYQSLLPLPVRVEKNQVKADAPANTINLEASARAKPMENDHPGLGLDVRHPSTTHPRLDSMEDFPDLHPSKLISQVRPTTSRR